MPLSDLQSGTRSFPFLRQWPGCQGTDAVGLCFSTSIADCSPPGWEGQRSPYQVSEGKSPWKANPWAGAVLGTLQACPHPLSFPPEHLDVLVPPWVRCPTSPKSKKEAPCGVCSWG